MSLFYSTAKYLSERFDADESHRSGAIDCRWFCLIGGVVFIDSYLMSCNKHNSGGKGRN